MNIQGNDRAAWLTGPAASCSTGPGKPPHSWRLVLLGAPGVGKGTQAQMLAERLGACHLSTGDIFRNSQALCEFERTDAMNRAIGFMRRGELVPDEIVLALLSERVGCLKCIGGFILDGFPRTVEQAKAFDGLLQSQQVQLDAVLNYELPLEQIVARLSGRRTCQECKAVFHNQTRRPKVEGVCDFCGGKLLQREDDRPEAIRVRMEAYERSTAPLIEFYRGQGLLVTIDARGSAEEIVARTFIPDIKRAC